MLQFFYAAALSPAFEGNYRPGDPLRPVRPGGGVRIFAQLLKADCAKNCSTFLNINKTPVPKSTLSQHFKILREAGLIRSERKGVELQNHSRCPELQKRFGPMITAILQAYQNET